jgi:two-component system OmpR family response regulator
MGEAEGPQAMIRVLYVEDDARLGRLTSTYLERHGLEVHLMTSGEQALAELGRVKPDVILLDVMLPGMDGRRVCARLREALDVPIIMVSALDEEVDRVLGLEGGADDYVTKPFSSRELLARIHAQVRRARGALGRRAERLQVGALVIDEAARAAWLGERRCR